MNIVFYNEELLIRRPAGPGDHYVMGNIEVTARATDASFSHAFGTEAAVEVEFTWNSFQPPFSGWLPGDIDYVKPALDRWLMDNHRRCESLFDKLSKR